MSDLWKGHWTKICLYAQKRWCISDNLSICSKSSTKAEDCIYYSSFFPSNMAVKIFPILFLAWKGILFTYHCEYSSTTYQCYTLGRMRAKVKELLMLCSELSDTKTLITHHPLRHNGICGGASWIQFWRIYILYFKETIFKNKVLKNPCSANFSAILILSGRKTKQQYHSLQGQQLVPFNPPCCSVQIWRCR